MKPIQTLADISPGSVLYHSAFGFSRVKTVDQKEVELEWLRNTGPLPNRIHLDGLLQVFSHVTPNGFFFQLAEQPEVLRESFQSNSTKVLESLLSELEGPQRVEDIRHWVVDWGLSSSSNFDRWWAAQRPIIESSSQFHLDADTILLKPVPNGSNEDTLLTSQNLRPNKRLEIALLHRETMAYPKFLDQVLICYKTGNLRVRELARTALQEESCEVIIGGLLRGPLVSIEAVIHAIRHSGWSPDDVPDILHDGLGKLVLSRYTQSEHVEETGRFAATLLRWAHPNIREQIIHLPFSDNKGTFVISILNVLTPPRGIDLILGLLAVHIQSKIDDTQEPQWLIGQLSKCVGVPPSHLRHQFEITHPEISNWLTENQAFILTLPEPTHSLENEEPTQSPPQIVEPTPFSKFPKLDAEHLLIAGLSMANALDQLPPSVGIKDLDPSLVFLCPDHQIVIETPELKDPTPDEENTPHNTLIEWAGSRLLELLIGKPWPDVVLSEDAIPYLRAFYPKLHPTALAPLLYAVHPIEQRRPSTVKEWADLWQAAMESEEERTLSSEAIVQFSVGFDSHIGRGKLLHTQTNQDAVFVDNQEPISMLVVCDGISIANVGSGDLASSIAVQVIANLWEQALPKLKAEHPSGSRTFLDQCLRAANQGVCDATLQLCNGELNGDAPMGTTIVAAIVHHDIVSLCWLGDSRAYLISDAGASQLTADQNHTCQLMEEWLEDRLPTWENESPALTGYLGHFNEWQKPELLEPGHLQFRLNPGESLVLCSDGVTDYVATTQADIAQRIAHAVDEMEAQDAATELICLANNGGGFDNATCVVATMDVVE